MRSDALRNRARILDAARALIATAGSAATMDDIARRAGVAVGTLYRHFPAKEDLVDAVVDDSVAAVAELAEAARGAAAAGALSGAELARLFAAVVERHAVDRAVKAAAGTLETSSDVVTAAASDSPAGRAVAAIEDLLARARTEGSVRADLTLADLVLLLDGAPDAGAGPQARARYVELVVNGWTARPAGPPQVSGNGG